MNRGFTQLDDAGRLRHLVTLDGLPRTLLTELLDRAQGYLGTPGALAPRGDDLAGWTVANLFAEPSTRTRASFELAAVRLGADAINLDVMLSSRAKGESIIDTIYTLQEMQVDVFVIRDAEPGIHEYVARHVGGHVAVISGGEAHVSHPTQGLLDALTIRQCKGGFDGLVVTIAGDIRHSRVARSAHRALATLGAAEIRIVAPPEFMPEAAEFAGARRLESFDQAVEGADVVMMLRIQRERAIGAAQADPVRYHQQYGLTAARLARAKPQAIVMHPGPMNRGVEVTSDVADGPQSVIRRQVANGVAVRMAVLAHIAAARRGRRG
ncbi:MAG TPA: aspartate carbamoyltransferase catalytic subunit [Steroidobacteraceae bacterium]|nr:aspartate carbamoyltransferase catalytic subunit [Steroidobacteraceae bacterium]